MSNTHSEQADALKIIPDPQSIRLQIGTKCRELRHLRKLLKLAETMARDNKAGPEPLRLVGGAR
jgi:hypothetical protein